ncbi:MAG: 6-phosphogluconolactonase [Acidobacteria bacterium]|nr:MAG: 6-phosphogluconolactonase [Acidobacteriota bacterium]
MDDSVSWEVRCYPDRSILTRRAAEEIAHRMRRAIALKGRCAVALAGGHTPRPVYHRLAEEHGHRLPWDRIHLFWGDERYVPPDDPQSNYGMVRQTLLDRISLPEENVHPMPTHISPPEEAARAYEQTLRSFFGDAGPTFDLVLLGVGADGHTASLFPGSPALRERARWVVVTEAPVEPRRRLSLTLPAINAADQVMFLVSGEEKRPVMRALLDEPQRARTLYPAAMVRPRGSVAWFVDRAALAEPEDSLR